MQTQTIEAIKTIFLEAIKILGPAFLVAFVTHKATKAQFESKLKELQISNEFSAREKLYNLHKERQEKFSKYYKDFQGTLGSVIGMLGTSAEDDPKFTSIFMENMGSFLDLARNLLPFEIEDTILEMQSHGLSDTIQFKKLMSSKNSLSTFGTDQTSTEFRRNVLQLAEILHYLEWCNQTLARRQMETMLSKYLRD